MEPFGFLTDLFIIFVVSGAVVYVFHRLRIPAVVGLLAAGVVMGPFGLSLVHEVERVHLLAEIGIIILLFSVGLEFSLPRLWSMWPLMVKVGIPQVVISGLGAGLVAYWYVESLNAAIFVGMLVSMSSTAIVLKVLTDRGEIGSPQGRVAVAVLLFQDLLVVAFMLLVPVLARQETDIPVWWALARGIGVVALVLAIARYLVPVFAFQLVRTRNRELFIILLIVLCLGTALLTASVGLSLALGAFLAGLALSESEYAHQTLAEVLPFRDTLASLFFVSVGMLLDAQYVLQHLPLVSAAVIGVLVLKSLAAAIPTMVIGYPPRIGLLTGLALAQVGEFSFVLVSRGREVGLMTADHYQLFLAVAVLTIALTPPLISGVTSLVSRLNPHREVDVGTSTRQATAEHGAGSLQDHVVICGYGVGGRNLARTLRATHIPYTILEMNPESVRKAREQGESIFYGDCTRPAVLHHLGIHTARLLAVMISDPASTRAVVHLARQMNPKLHIIARTRYLGEVEDLRRLGATQIIPEELETAVEIFARVLAEYSVPRNVVLELIDQVRSDHYEMLRTFQPAAHDSLLPGLPADLPAQIQMESCLLRENSPAVGRTVRELALRQASGASVVGVRRGSELLLDVAPELQLGAGDTVLVIGGRAQVTKALTLLDPFTYRDGEPSAAASEPS